MNKAIIAIQSHAALMVAEDQLMAIQTGPRHADLMMAGDQLTR